MWQDRFYALLGDSEVLLKWSMKPVKFILQFVAISYKAEKQTIDYRLFRTKYV